MLKQGVVWGVLGEGTHFFFIGAITLIDTISSCIYNFILCILNCKKQKKLQMDLFFL
jgi:hypothetical protein